MFSELYFWILSGDCGNCCFLKKKIFEIILYLCFYPKSSNYFHYSGMFSHRKLPDLSLNNISSVLSIGLQYTLSFKGADFGLKCRVTIIFFQDSNCLQCQHFFTIRCYFFAYLLLEKLIYPSQY